MKPKEFRTIYLAFSNLYGAIYSDDAYLIMKYYFPSLKKKEMYQDMKSRKDKFTRGYEVVGTTDSKYVIKADYLSFDDLDRLFAFQGDKPFYYPETFEEMESYSNSDYWFTDNKKTLDMLSDFLDKRIDVKDETKRAINVIAIIYMIRIYIESIDHLNTQQYFDLLEERGVKLKSSKDGIEFMRMFQTLNNNTRHITNRGFTPTELSNLSGPVDPSNIKLTIGPNLRKRLLEEDGAIEEYIDQIKKMDIPNLAKHSLLMEANEILKEVKSRQA